MNCLICSQKMHFYFSKSFTDRHLSNVNYYRCENCGFCISKTHAEMTPEEFSEVNADFHSRYLFTDENPLDPCWKRRLQTQADVIADLCRFGLLDRSKLWLDYACGDGSLSELLATNHQLELLKYDRYLPEQSSYLDIKDLASGGFDFVITTSVFEHLTKREHFDEINMLVSADGVMGLHTMVREVVPQDPAWFYLHPVHCAFHTNKSMEILFEQWGYRSSIYHVDSRIWFWFKSDPGRIEEIVRKANDRRNLLADSPSPYYEFKKGFADYWKE